QNPVNVRIPVHICPSALASTRNAGPIGDAALPPTSRTAEMGDYFAIRSFVDGEFTPNEIDGMGGTADDFNNSRPQLLAQIADGLSNTMMLYESAGWPQFFQGRTVAPCSASAAAGGLQNCVRNWFNAWAGFHNNRLYSWTFDGKIRGDRPGGAPCVVNCTNDV